MTSKVASLFCGCGGSDLGLLGGFDYLGKSYKKLDFEIVYALDFDKWAVDTYNKNFEHKAVCADICDVEFSVIPDVDLMIGGFPCQSFSTVNPTKDTNDARANLYKQIVRFLEVKRPKYFICENVKGLMTLQRGAIIDKILSEFSSMGYHVKYKLVKAVEFGIPQRRERVIIVGIRNDIDVKYEYPHPTNNEKNYVPLKAVIDKLYVENQKYYFSERAVQGVKNAKNNMKRGLWQDLNQPCLTITAHLAKTSMNSRDPILLVDADKELYRRFTPREAARIQSFPDTFLLNDSEPKSYKQIGNAIPPVMMWHIAKALQTSMTNKEKNKAVVHQLNFAKTKEEYPNNIIENVPSFWNESDLEVNIDFTKNVLISLVKADNMEQYLDRSAKVYYTGKKFPSTVALNKLYYFMPYLKRRGVRDLYLINIARVGTKKEVHPECDDNDFRLVFEIQFVKQLFDDYQPIHLDIWQAFTDTTISGLQSKIEEYSINKDASTL